MAHREVVIVSGVRTGIADFGGALKDFPPTKLGDLCIAEALARGKVEPASIGHRTAAPSRSDIRSARPARSSRSRRSTSCSEPASATRWLCVNTSCGTENPSKSSVLLCVH